MWAADYERKINYDWPNFQEIKLDQFDPLS